MGEITTPTGTLNKITYPVIVYLSLNLYEYETPNKKKNNEYLETLVMYSFGPGQTTYFSLGTGSVVTT